LPAAHLGQLDPQSTSVSVPFLAPSEQVAIWQNPAVHTPLAQSLACVHFLPLPHLGQLDPPQSVSVSVALGTKSAHVGA
jgi:hypothetical protein